MSGSGSECAFVRFEMVGEHIALVTLDRPEKRNAINGDMAGALDGIVQATEEDPQVRAVILASSHERVFCAGADLSVGPGAEAAAMETENGGFAGLVYAQRTKPWIAAVDGLAVAGGFELCLACDMIVASKDAAFGLPEVKRGLMAGSGGLHRLPSRIPAAIAYEMIATGDPVDAGRAHQHGLVNRLAEPGEALAEANTLAERIVCNAPLAVQYSLSAARTGADLPDGEGRTVVDEWLSHLRESKDFMEGPRAFIEKRDPVWTGR